MMRIFNLLWLFEEKLYDETKVAINSVWFVIRVGKRPKLTLDQQLQWSRDIFCFSLEIIRDHRCSIWDRVSLWRASKNLLRVICLNVLSWINHFLSQCIIGLILFVEENLAVVPRSAMRRAVVAAGPVINISSAFSKWWEILDLWDFHWRTNS